ncbi:hypothetical protein NDN08_005938 [Rhodosorus marinus]|uniref:Amino acid transporter transmembrane domain-containing protein n=1 Tax=Rhodosorus marinus TaxID=101924 RepID=A0AAV8UNF9_9RHOD|nr:hypothetical protein NDN08_005938 [Rhodosorus marinus]
MGLDFLDPEHLEPHIDADYDAEENAVKDANAEAAEGANTFLHEQEEKLRRSGPFKTYLMLIAVTLNFLMVPGFFSGMGWALAVVVLVWGWSHSLVTGLMLDKISEDKPQILSYPDLGGYVGAKLFKGSKHGRRAGFWIIWTSQAIGQFLISVANLGFCAQFFQAIFPQPCYTWWIVISYGFTVFLSQIPTFHESFGVNVLSMSSMAVLFVLIIVNIAVTGKLEEVSYNIGNVTTVFNGMAGICFAFGGHALFPEARREMKEPEKFKVSIYWMYATLGVTMVVVGFLGYGMFGTEAQINIFDNFTWNVSVTVGNVFMLLAFFGALVIGNIISMMAVQTVLKIPLLGWRKPRSYGMPAGVTRVLLRASIVTLELLLALLIPFIGDLVGLTGAFSSTILTFLFPSIAYWVIFNKRISIYMKLFCALLIVLSVVICVAGAYGSMVGLIESATAFPPFNLPCSYLDLP